MRFLDIIEHKSCVKYLQSRQLLDQYKKAKDLLLSGNLQAVDFKKRHPYKSEKYYFRINGQFRAIGYLQWDTFVVFEIDNHQN